MNAEWRKKFNLSRIDWDAWKATGEKESFAVWALEKGKITADQYKEWVVEHHRLPFLQDSFFQDMGISSVFWNKVKDKENWSETFVPLYEWDSVLFAGCLEPLKETKNPNTVPILVAPKNLQFFWNKIVQYKGANSLSASQNFQKMGAEKPTTNSATQVVGKLGSQTSEKSHSESATHAVGEKIS